MNKEIVIVVTGAAGFIGSCLAAFLNEKGFTNLVLVDDFINDPDKAPNLIGKKFISCIEREQFFEWLSIGNEVDFIFHLGARTDTTEHDYSIHQYLNVEYSQNLWKYCVEAEIPLVYASSAATYGDGRSGYNDDHAIVSSLQPLNAYGISKNEFDKWALKQVDMPPFWAGLKFFNVYGPNEYHKGRMASVVWHTFNQVRENGMVKLFRSHRDDYEDGGQLRDFIYVKDILKVCCWMMEHCNSSESDEEFKKPANGLYNLGTGKANSFNQLAESTFVSMNRKQVIEYIDIPEDIRDKYQYYTQAEMNKLKNAGYTTTFYSLQDGIQDYVKNYLAKGKYY